MERKELWKSRTASILLQASTHTLKWSSSQLKSDYPLYYKVIILSITKVSRTTLRFTHTIVSPGVDIVASFFGASITRWDMDIIINIIIIITIIIIIVILLFTCQGYRCKNPNCDVDVHEWCREVWSFFLQFSQFLLQLCTIACGVDFAEMVKVVENIKKKEVPKFDLEKARQQDILELKGRVPKLTKEQSIKISLADFTLKTTLGRGGYGKVKIKTVVTGCYWFNWYPLSQYQN